MTEAVWHVYLLECADGTLYCGVTSNLERRLAQHNGLKPGGARYTRGRRPVRLVASLACAHKGTALCLECAVKSRPRNQKIHFLQSGGEQSCRAPR
ncbi:GIY-YIG nuclease family protein [Desulfovibrio sp. ZJ200]|uniref:GIY-YIG nuclease family protein n=1 Tax=Desulfovibrio sp. ZJ200 TaxID=2709792 RepID=UPI0013ED8393|nr:GIY-YIG nuclease family protein [Desulfovibrio sp. ZJ200]